MAHMVISERGFESNIGKIRRMVYTYGNPFKLDWGKYRAIRSPFADEEYYVFWNCGSKEEPEWYLLAFMQPCYLCVNAHEVEREHVYSSKRALRFGLDMLDMSKDLYDLVRYWDEIHEANPFASMATMAYITGRLKDEDLILSTGKECLDFELDALLKFRQNLIDYSTDSDF
jgi:hypothetical protein